jgi:membrane protein YdbS with pleckstrin-like domain
MLTKEEEDFIVYWSEQRKKNKRSLTQFTVGLPLAVSIVAALFVNIITGWHKRAAMVLRSNASLIIVILLACVGIVIFMTIFSQRHKWEYYEQRYQELLFKKQQWKGE